MFLIHNKTGEIYPYSKEWANSGKFRIFESLMEYEQEQEIDELAPLRKYTPTTIDKYMVEIELERLVTDKEFRDIKKRLFNG